MTNTVRTSRALKFNAHVVAFNRHMKANPVEIVALDLTPATEDDFAVPGEMTILTDAEFESAIEALDAKDEVYAGQDEDEGPAGQPQDEIEADTRSFTERYIEVESAAAEAMLWSIANRIDDRIAHQADASPVSIKNLNRARAKMVTGRVSRALCAVGLADAGFVNREWRDGSQFNVYALLKLPDLIAGLIGGTVTNAINIAVVKSMFALEKAGIGFDLDTAKAAASSEYAPARAGVRQHLTRHTVKRGTASTQASSTMHALMALGVVSFVPSVNPTYTILQNATTEALRNAKFEMAEEA